MSEPESKTRMEVRPSRREMSKGGKQLEPQFLERFGLHVLPSSFYFLAHSSTENDYASAGASLLILVTLFCAWLLIFSFTFNGSKALRKVSIYWWALPILTAGFAVVITVNLWLTSTIEPSAVNTFAWGVPFLIPLLHLCAERWWRSSANPLLNTDAPQEPRRAG